MTLSGPWKIAATVDRVELGEDGTAELVFTVSNDGPVDRRVVVDAVPGDGSERTWFAVAEPQRLVPHGATVSFLVRIAVPPDEPPGSYWLAARAYSADGAPEDSVVVSERVAFQVSLREPDGKPDRRWWWLIPAAVLVLAVIGVVLFLVLGGGGDPTVRVSDDLVVPPVARVDLDEVRLITADSEDSGTDLQFVIDNFGEFLAPRNGADLAAIGPAGTPLTACEAATLSARSILVPSLNVDDVVCVRTNEGRLSVMTVTSPFSVSFELRVSVTTYELEE